MASTDAWADLAEAIEIFRTGNVNPINPFDCSHNTLGVMASPESYTEEQLARLDELGFNPDIIEEIFYSFRFGSAE